MGLFLLAISGVPYGVPFATIYLSSMGEPMDRRGSLDVHVPIISLRKNFGGKAKLRSCLRAYPVISQAYYL